jgi:hypothetical protein
MKGHLSIIIHGEMVKQHMLEDMKKHVKIDEMILEKEHVNSGVMKFELRKLMQKKIQQE